jgi:hypothetical protein|tara:strand:+ start:118 stop:339 length:222 start_codon:yes stop_codon:yes gene_type:complete
MDKVYITKEELTKSIQNKRKNSGPFITALVLFWILVSSILFLIPSIVFGLALLIVYIPFYFIDQHILERKING